MIEEEKINQSWKPFWLVGAFTLIGIGIGELIDQKSACTLIGMGVGLIIYVLNNKK